MALRYTLSALQSLFSIEGFYIHIIFIFKQNCFRWFKSKNEAPILNFYGKLNIRKSENLRVNLCSLHFFKLVFFTLTLVSSYLRAINKNLSPLQHEKKKIK